VKAVEEVVGKWRTTAAQVENLMCRRWQFDTWKFSGHSYGLRNSTVW
jgi:hypothetical protein